MSRFMKRKRFTPNVSAQYEKICSPRASASDFSIQTVFRRNYKTEIALICQLKLSDFLINLQFAVLTENCEK